LIKMYQEHDYEDYGVEYDEYDEYGGDGEFGGRQQVGNGQANFIPSPIKKFLEYFYEIYTKGDSFELTKLYERTFPELTEQHFKNTPWPEVEELLTFLPDDNSLFFIIYKELYFRHIYAKVQGGPSIEQRFESYQNYCDLFNFILSTETPVVLELPNQWLWEIVDEFIYQFQSFQQFRGKIQKKSDKELNILKQYPTTWQALQVLNVLHSMLDKSNINQQLAVYAKGENPDTVAGEFGRVRLYKMMGYFSLIGLLRLHSLLGDYFQAIKVLEHIELNKKSMYSRVPGCQISMYYYVGFAYLMMRRYNDAIRTFSNILVYIQRAKGMFQSKTYQNDQINKQTDQMYVLLAICLVLHPKRIDESLHATLKEKSYAEKINKMQNGDLDEFQESFLFACPKFLPPVPPSLEDPSHGRMAADARNLQVRVFMDEVRQQTLLPVVRSYLKLYTSMPIDKLALYMDDTTVDELESNLLAFKHKMMNLVWSKGTSGLTGDFKTESEVDFFIDKNMIHIADTKVDRRYGDYFIRQILKFEEQNRALKLIKM